MGTAAPWLMIYGRADLGRHFATDFEMSWTGPAPAWGRTAWGFGPCRASVLTLGSASA